MASGRFTASGLFWLGCWQEIVQELLTMEAMHSV